MSASANKPPGSNRRILALDFDGVICDSAGECLLSAYATYVRGTSSASLHDLESLVKHWRTPFYRMRPFTRDGKDYLITAYFIDKELSIESQADFDRESQRKLPDVCKALAVTNSIELEELFQNTRRRIRAWDKVVWYRLNPLYPEMLKGLRNVRDLSSILITTSKLTDTVIKILAHHGVSLPQSQIYGSDKVAKGVGKNSHLEKVFHMTRAAPDQIHFLDDQVSHLKAAQPLGVQCHLATWGYTTAQQQDEARQLKVTLLPQDRVASWIMELTQSSDD